MKKPCCEAAGFSCKNLCRVCRSLGGQFLWDYFGRKLRCKDIVSSNHPTHLVNSLYHLFMQILKSCMQLLSWLLYRSSIHFPMGVNHQQLALDHEEKRFLNRGHPKKSVTYVIIRDSEYSMLESKSTKQPPHYKMRCPDMIHKHWIESGLYASCLYIWHVISLKISQNMNKSNAKHSQLQWLQSHQNVRALQPVFTKTYSEKTECFWQRSHTDWNTGQIFT